MKPLYLLSFALILTGAVSAAISDPVRLDSGSVSGIPVDDAGVRMFKGIPFAAPPVGDLRWRAPQPAAHWDGVRKADQFGPTCTAGGGGGRGGEGQGPRRCSQGSGGRPKREHPQDRPPAKIACTSTSGRPRKRRETGCL